MNQLVAEWTELDNLLHHVDQERLAVNVEGQLHLISTLGTWQSAGSCDTEIHILHMTEDAVCLIV